MAVNDIKMKHCEINYGHMLFSLRSRETTVASVNNESLSFHESF